MKKVILAAAAFAALSINANAQTGNLGTSDDQNFSVSINAQDMIEITPDDASGITYSTGALWAGWDVLNNNIRTTVWTINATHGYTFSVQAVPSSTAANNLWLKNPASVNDANKYLKSNRFGLSVSVGAFDAGVAMGNTHSYVAGQQSTSYPLATDGLTGDVQPLGETTTHGVLNQKVTTVLSFFPSVYDGISGTYNGTLAFTAELKP